MMKPRTVQLESDDRLVCKPLSEDDHTHLESSFVNINLDDIITASGTMPRKNRSYQADIESLYKQISCVISSKPKELATKFDKKNNDPFHQPLFWVSKWIDYSDKYGFAYQLSDASMGVVFNDITKLIMLANGLNLHYIDKEGVETYSDTNNYPPHMEKKMKLLFYFKDYMTKTLVDGGAGEVNIEKEHISRIPHLHTWFRTLCGVLMHLTNGTVQFNFFDHQKIILCPLMGAVTLMDSNNKLQTYRFSTIQEQGCSTDLYEKLLCAHEMLKKLQEKLV